MPLANCLTHDRAENTSRLRQWVAGEASAWDSAVLAETRHRHPQGRAIRTETQTGLAGNLIQIALLCHASDGNVAIR